MKGQVHDHILLCEQQGILQNTNCAALWTLRVMCYPAGDPLGCKRARGGRAQDHVLRPGAARAPRLEPQHPPLPVRPGRRPHHAGPGHARAPLRHPQRGTAHPQTAAQSFLSMAGQRKSCLQCLTDLFFPGLTVCTSTGATMGVYDACDSFATMPARPVCMSSVRICRTMATAHQH